MADLSERYGARSWTRDAGGRKLVVALVVVLVGAGLSWLAWVILEHGRPTAQGQLVSYDVTGPHTVEARFTVVRRDPGVEASCLLRAMSTDHAVVGELDVPVGPGGPTTETLRRPIRTEREATTVEMVGCLAEGQAQRR